MKYWYVVQTKPRQESIAEENLQRQSFQCFLPRIKQWRSIRGKRKQVEEAFFPGYLFVYLDCRLTDITPIRSTRGVAKMVQFGKILSVPHMIVESLRHQADENNIVDIADEKFRPGQEVCIEEGPLSGLRAIFQAKSGKDRAYVLLNLLGSQQSVEVPLAIIDL